MVRGKSLIPLVFLSVLAVVLYAATPVHTTKTAYLPITDAGDTALVMKLNKFTAIDSFVYSLDLEGYGSGLGADSAVAWVSPLQVMRINVASVVDTALTYSIDIAYQAGADGDTVGFDYDIAGIDDTLANLIAELVDSINNVSGFGDSVVAVDSGTYIKVTSLFKQERMLNDARWTLILGDSLSKGDSTVTTLAMVCDSLAAAFNGTDSVSGVVTAANGGDSIILVTSDKKGVTFTLDVADSSLDTATVTANATSRSTHTDTIPNIVGLHGGQGHAGGLYGTIILKASTDTGDGGIGKDDSAIVWLYTVFRDQSTNGQYFLLDSAIMSALPGSLHVAIPRDSAGVDTLFKDVISIVYYIGDSTSDTTFWPSYDMQIDLNIYEQ